MLNGMVETFARRNLSQVSKLDRWYKQWADVKGPDCLQCQELGQLISQEIDAVKTGQYVQFDPDTLRPPSSPQSGCVSEIHRASTILQEMRALLQAFVIAELDQHDRQKLSVDGNGFNVVDIKIEQVIVRLEDKTSAWNPFDTFKFAVKWAQVTSCCIFRHQ
mmetsp:Transcript_60597/g.88769  ORF Transcript_60597/g.88769 Transcript_60597/m.88769 type:complete len:162 (+) Transcript_60597:1360-1845(+)